MCRYTAIQSDYVLEQCMAFLVDYVSDVRQASCIDVLHVSRPVSDAGILCEKIYTEGEGKEEGNREAGWNGI